jgi:hypothetical protein
MTVFQKLAWSWLARANREIRHVMSACLIRLAATHRAGVRSSIIGVAILMFCLPGNL